MSWPAAMLGVVNLDKPLGPTSHDMVDLVRRLTGMRRIGHAGTLDPLASGVLPILVGAATRFSDDLTGGPKRYDAVIRLGIRSATDDAPGPFELVGAAARHGDRRAPGWRRSSGPSSSVRRPFRRARREALSRIGRRERGTRWRHRRAA